MVKESLTTTAEGRNYATRCYILDAILAVGFRVRSPRGNQFRQWASERLREYLAKGFTLDDERLKHPPRPGLARLDECLRFKARAVLPGAGTISHGASMVTPEVAPEVAPQVRRRSSMSRAMLRPMTRPMTSAE